MGFDRQDQLQPANPDNFPDRGFFVGSDDDDGCHAPAQLAQPALPESCAKLKRQSADPALAADGEGVSFHLLRQDEHKEDG